MTYVHVVHGWVWKWGQQLGGNANWPCLGGSSGGDDQVHNHVNLQDLLEALQMGMTMQIFAREDLNSGCKIKSAHNSSAPRASCLTP